MEFQNNQLFTFLLFLVAFYLLNQIMNGDVSAENMMETEQMPQVLPPSMSTGGLQSNVNPSTQFVSLQPSNNAVPQMPTMMESQSPGVGFAPLAPESSGNSFAPLHPDMISQQSPTEYGPLYKETNYTAPSQGNIPVPSQQYNNAPEGGAFATSNGTGLSYNSNEAEMSQNYNYFPDPVDSDNLFNHSGSLNPGDLLPTDDSSQPPLFSNFNENPNLNQNFLQNRFSIGLDCSQLKKKGQSSLDLRGYPNSIPAMQAVSPFQNASTPLDLFRRSLADIA